MNAVKPPRDGQLLSLDHGFIYFARHARSIATRRHPGVILLSPQSKPLRLETKGQSFEASALVVAPRVVRSLYADNTPFAALHVEPSHPAYRMFEFLPEEGGVCALSRRDFKAFDKSLAAYQMGTPNTAEVEDLFEGIVARTQRFLGAPPAQDKRMTAIIDYISRQPPEDYCFADLMDMARLSAGRLSHLFTEQIGLSLRSFLIWRKTKEAIALFPTSETLTTIAHASGFADSAHFCRTFQKSLGLPPSRFRGDSCVQVYNLASS
ncbi:MAG: AraC family transcriptional regulator [Pseudomonadota bacterium]